MPTATRRLAAHWDAQYLHPPQPWETGYPSSELQRMIRQWRIPASSALELGCGTGTNALWLAEQGFRVTAIDLSKIAIEEARRKARSLAVQVRFVVGDLGDWWKLGGAYDFFFDCGCYHAARLINRKAYHETLARVTRPGTVGLLLAGNAREPEDDAGPPTLQRQTLEEEFTGLFEILQLREFRFDPPATGGTRYLGWSCLLRRPATNRRR